MSKSITTYEEGCRLEPSLMRVFKYKIVLLRSEDPMSRPKNRIYYLSEQIVYGMAQELKISLRQL